VSGRTPQSVSSKTSTLKLSETSSVIATTATDDSSSVEAIAAPSSLDFAAKKASEATDYGLAKKT
jgi:hypothetical protein